MKLSKEAASKKIYECAHIYKKNLLGNNVLFLTLNDKNECNHFESIFLARNFKHLTGIYSTFNGAQFFQKLTKTHNSFH